MRPLLYWDDVLLVSIGMACGAVLHALGASIMMILIAPALAVGGWLVHAAWRARRRIGRTM